MAITVVDTGVELKSAPLPRDWIIEGRPVTRNAILAKSTDRTALTMLWDCTAGGFRWIYRQEETIHVLEGGATLTFEDGRVVELTPGSVVFFPAGCTVDWRVHSYIRKLAVFRETIPAPFALAVRLRAKLRPSAWMGRVTRRPPLTEPLLPQAA